MGPNAPSSVRTRIFRKSGIVERKKRHTIKYEIGVSLLNPQIVWVSGPVEGSVHDLTMTRRSKLFMKLLPGERVWGDMGYIGHPRMLTPLKKNWKGKPQIRDLLNPKFGKIRVRIEHMLDRIKIFGCLKQTWRHSLKLHQVAFYVAINLMAFEIKMFPIKQ